MSRERGHGHLQVGIPVALFQGTLAARRALRVRAHVLVGACRVTHAACRELLHPDTWAPKRCKICRDDGTGAQHSSFREPDVQGLVQVSPNKKRWRKAGITLGRYVE